MISVYLDSQDYSTLSNENISKDERIIKDRLLELANSGEVDFFFSCVVVCEVAPVGSSGIQPAIRRGDFLTEICKRNSLLNPFDLWENEINSHGSFVSNKVEVKQTNGNWFPQIELDDPPRFEDLFQSVLEEELENYAPTRQQRRALKRKIIKNGKLTNSASNYLNAENPQDYVDLICKNYPMKPEYADVLHRYYRGTASKEDASAALENSLRDPCWMMRWFATTESLSEKLTKIIRGPGAEMAEHLKNMISIAHGIRENQPELSEKLFSRSRWQSDVEKSIIRTFTNISESQGNYTSDADCESIARYCPGFYTMISALYSSVWDNISDPRKKLPSNSQFPDAVHALYAPYVDIFRADRYMAPHISKYVQHRGTNVVSRLADLPNQIEKAIAKGA